eukprot:CAMPEP_0197622628 /NCGR_PEP_ID=MMETSP1338-20131121/2851_1 /TAXON_ID=43686 ORGANISM="Pelagodinium beii, Strain RCC1491" /NCGR_SAMPLE_ID=MMETSP1338 /ASSEMBLY_ACC=CAM_ASM_000754 /LENGTH=542 /DNA_ID=CAMNT_0043192373 /DNA_START=20 /DNA_END=1645 /DNA_ORIENTATION=+
MRALHPLMSGRKQKARCVCLTAGLVSFAGQRSQILAFCSAPREDLRPPSEVRMSLGGRGVARAAMAEAISDIQDLRAFSVVDPGQWLPASIRHQASYGVWVDVQSPGQTGQAVAGLVHLSEMGDKALQALQPGEEVMVRVSSVDSHKGHLGLSMCLPSASSQDGYIPKADLTEDISGFSGVYACEWFRGHVADCADAVSSEGVHVDLIPPGGVKAVRGLVPLRRIDIAGENLSSTFRPNQEVHVRVVSSFSQLELSMKGSNQEIQADLEAQLKALEPPVSTPMSTDSEVYGEMEEDNAEAEVQPLPDIQDVSSFVGLSADQWLDARIHHSASFGVYVVVSPPAGPAAWGLVHLSELPGEIPESGVVRVRLKSVDVAKGRLQLSMRSQKGSVATAQSGQDAATWVTGTVAEVVSYGLVVDLPGSRGLVYSTELEDPGAVFVPGETVQVRVIDTDMEPGLLGLSMRRDMDAIQAQLEAEKSWLTGTYREREEDRSADSNDLELRAMREQLRSFLGVSPKEVLKASVQGDTPFGVLVHVPHPNGR